MNFTIELSKAQLEVVLAGLGELPLKSSGNTAQAIIAQVQKQMGPVSPSVEDTPQPPSPPASANKEKAN